MLTSQSSMRLPMYSGVHSTVRFASRIGSRISSTEMNQSSEIRKMRGVWQRQHSGYRWVIVPASTSRSRGAEVADDVVGGLVGGAPGQPAVVGVEAAGLVDGGEHGEVVHLAQLEVLGAAPGRDVHDAGALLERDLVPADHPVLDGARPGPRASKGPS